MAKKVNTKAWASIALRIKLAELLLRTVTEESAFAGVLSDRHVLSLRVLADNIHERHCLLYEALAHELPEFRDLPGLRIEGANYAEARAIFRTHTFSRDDTVMRLVLQMVDSASLPSGIDPKLIHEGVDG
jgi:hypothetical protein